jgi:hypothetical protein
LYKFFSPCTKSNSKWIKDLNLRPETLKLLGEKNLENTGLSKKTPVVQEIRAR